jgi:hypothetical protein
VVWRHDAQSRDVFFPLTTTFAMSRPTTTDYASVPSSELKAIIEAGTPSERPTLVSG